MLALSQLQQSMFLGPETPEETPACQPRQWSSKVFTEPFLTTLGFFPFPPTLSGTAQQQSDILDEMGQPRATAPHVLH